MPFLPLSCLPHAFKKHSLFSSVVSILELVEILVESGLCEMSPFLLAVNYWALIFVSHSAVFNYW